VNTLVHVIVARVGIENTCILPTAGFQSNSTISMLTRLDREMFVLTWVVGHFDNMKFRCYFHSNPLRVNFFLSFQIASSNFMCHDKRYAIHDWSKDWDYQGSWYLPRKSIAAAASPGQSIETQQLSRSTMTPTPLLKWYFSGTVY